MSDKDAKESVDRMNAKVRKVVGTKVYGTVSERKREQAIDEALIAIADALTDVGVVVGLDVKESDAIDEDA